MLDPACGSGAFLIAAFDLLAREYARTVDRLTDLGESIEFDIFDEIVTQNLFGVDLNAESVEITRLSLWLKTARREHRLQNLEGNILVGDSIVSDGALTARPFDWDTAFERIGGRFDVVIGNPPYVRSETISKIKPHLRANYECFDGSADLYCYFYERALRLLRDGGRLGFISSLGFFKTAFGANLRKLLERRCTFETGIDFGDARIFEDVTTYTAALTLRCSSNLEPYSFPFLNFEGSASDDLDAHFRLSSFPFPSERLQRSRWHFEPKRNFDLRDKLEARAEHRLLSVGTPVSGIKTGLTKAFVIDQKRHDALLLKSSSSADLIRRWAVGDDLEKWTPEGARRFLIFIPKGWTKTTFGLSDEESAWKRFCELYPAISSWLTSFEKDARKRSDQGDFWWELRACDYYELFDEELVTFPEMSQGPKFCLKQQGIVSNNKTFLIPNSTLPLLAYLNSRVGWFLLHGICTALRGGKWRLELRSDFVRDVPLPEFGRETNAALQRIARECAEQASFLRAAAEAGLNRLGDLNRNPAKLKPNQRLQEWWLLDFSELRSELKRSFKIELAVKERDEWQAYLAGLQKTILDAESRISALEAEADHILYSEFELTNIEVATLNEALKCQY